jgi:hypothetical protein
MEVSPLEDARCVFNVLDYGTRSSVSDAELVPA